MTNERTIADFGEHRLIDLITAAVKKSCQGDVARIGDDAAILSAARARSATLVSTDLLIEGTHWRPAHMTPAMLGRRALVVNLSDIAAMGARPAWFTLGLGLPPHQPLSWFRQFLRGLIRAADEFHCPLIGGDLVRAPVPSIAITVAGSPIAKRPAVRTGAKRGDKVYVTGDLGRSRLALATLEGEETLLKGRRTALEKFQKPMPRLAEADALIKCGGITAMMDVSDGLHSDVGWISRLSGAQIEIELDRIPIHRVVRDHLNLTGRSPALWAASSGEEFELLFTSKKSAATLSEALAKAGLKTGVTEIGSVAEGSGVSWNLNGCRVKMEPGGGFDHFSHGGGPEQR